MDIAIVESYLQQYGWSYEHVERDSVVANFITDQAGFIVVFQLVDSWLRMSIPAYHPAPASEKSEAFLRQLLQLNHRSRTARFALDNNNGVILCLDIYAGEEVSYQEFERGLDVLTYTAEAAYGMLFPESKAEEEE